MSANNIEYLKTRDIDVNPVQTIKRIYRFISIFSILLVIFWFSVIGVTISAVIPGSGIETHPGKELERIRGSLVAYGIIVIIFVGLFIWNLGTLGKAYNDPNGAINSSFKVAGDFATMYQGKSAGKLLTNGVSNLLSPRQSFASTIETHYKNSKIDEGIKRVFTKK